MCRVLGISRSTLYYDRKNPQRALDTPEQIRVVQQDLEEHHYSFGRRVTKKNLEKKGFIFSVRGRLVLQEQSEIGRKALGSRSEVIKYQIGIWGDGFA